MRTYLKKNKNKLNLTKKNTKFSYIKTQKIIVLTFLQMLNTVKLYHWKTHSYAQHKASDKLYSELNENIDSFVETMLGKHGNRVDLTNIKCLPLFDYNSLKGFQQKVNQYKTFLINMTYNADLNLTNNSDLLNIRDEILGNINQFEYLLTFY